MDAQRQLKLGHEDHQAHVVSKQLTERPGTFSNREKCIVIKALSQGGIYLDAAT